MNVIPYETHIEAQKVAFTSMDEFIERIQNIIVTGGHNFLHPENTTRKTF